jgi:hypothetical protein
VHNSHTQRITRVRQVGIEEWICLLPYDDIDGDTTRGYICARQLPITQVSSNEYYAATGSDRPLQRLPVMYRFHKIEHPFLSKIRKQRDFHSGTSKMLERLARNTHDSIV